MLRGRLVGLREYRREDVEAMHELWSDAEFVALADGAPFRARTLAVRLADYDRRAAEQDESRVTFAVQRLDDEAGAAIGSITLWSIDLYNRGAHIGMQLLPSARGAGLGRDALEVVCRYGFELRGLERLALETLELNEPMRAVAKACGFVEEGRLRSAAWYLGRRVDEVLYGLLADEWRQRA